MSANRANLLALFINPPAKKTGLIREGRCIQSSGAWSTQWPPLSLALCSAIAKNANIRSLIIDCTAEKIDECQIFVRVANIRPDIIVFPTAILPDDLYFATLCKNACHSVIVITYGIHSKEIQSDYCAESGDLDGIISGEPEYALRGLFTFACKLPIGKKYYTREKLKECLENLPSVGVPKKGKKLTFNERKNIDINTIPLPSWELIDKNLYKMPGKDKPFLLVQTSRGCSEKCLFCSASEYYGTEIRLRARELILEDIEKNIKDYEIRDYLFWSENFTANYENAHLLCEEILKRKLKISWVCNSRVDNCDYELFKIMRKAGCWMIGFGIESGSERMLKLMRKGINVKHIKDAMLKAKKAKLTTTAHMILGFPMESKGDTLKSIRLIDVIKPDFVQYYLAAYYPGSKYHKLYENNNGNKGRKALKLIKKELRKADEFRLIRIYAYLKFYLKLDTIKRISRFDLIKKVFSNFGDILKWIIYE